MSTVLDRPIAGASRNHSMPAEQSAQALMASMKLGEKVTDPNEVGAAIRRGVDAVKNGAPAVLDMWLPKLITGEV